MIKSICALAHKSGSDRAAFQRYYEDHHAPLAIGLFPFSGYVRNHLVGAETFDWDTISEFWSQEIEAAAALMAGPVGETLHADEERFMDRAKIAPAGAEEIILSDGPAADDSDRRTALLVAGSLPTMDFRAQVLDVARAFSGAHRGVSMDWLTSGATPAFPAVAIIWLPGWHKDIVVPDWLNVRQLNVQRFATPTDTLLRHA